MSSQSDANALIIWDYMHMNHMLKKSDIIIALGSSDISVAERAAELYLQGYAPRILFSGGLGKITNDKWKTTEAEKFKSIAIEKGVPEDHILVEKDSTNTGENIKFSIKLLELNGMSVSTAIVVCKPYKERRDYATFKKQWGELDIVVTSPEVTFKEYMETIFSKDEAMNLLVGDLQRIKVYEEQGYQIHQDIPDEVWSAYEALVQDGYDKYLVK